MNAKDRRRGLEQLAAAPHLLRVLVKMARAQAGDDAAAVADDEETDLRRAGLAVAEAHRSAAADDGGGAPERGSR